MTGKPSVLRDADIKFIEAQRLFFVATAATEGSVNLSPKGMDSLRVLSPQRIVWLSVSGSGNETAAHVVENARMTLMFCAFEGKAKIVRAYGSARVIYPRNEKWAELIGLFPTMAGSRQIFDLSIDRVLYSCGTGVPVYAHQHDRGPSELLPFYEKMGEEGVRAYWQRKNRISIDGKPTDIFDE